MRVVLTREAGRNTEMTSWLPEGAEVVEVPLTETFYLDRTEVERRLDAVATEVRWASLVITSARASRYVDLALARCASGVEVFSVGPKTTRALTSSGATVRAQSVGGAVDLSRQIRRGPVALVGAATMRPELADDLRTRGFVVATIACYETRPVVPDAVGRAALAGADVVFIGAPSAWSGAKDLVPDAAWVVVPGASTARTVRVDHARVLEGWGPSLRTRLQTPEDPTG